MARSIITDENGVRSISPNVQEDIWFFDPANNVYMGKGTTGDGNTYILADNIVFIEPPEIPDGQVAVWNSETEAWELVNDKCYIIDDQGFFQNEIPHPLLPGTDQIYTLIMPPDGYEAAHYSNESGWQDFPRPTEGYYVPVFEGYATGWIESLSGTDFNIAVDRETWGLVRKWCIDQGKCEEYYINRGITIGADDSEYITYITQKDSIITSQASKKV